MIVVKQVKYHRRKCRTMGILNEPLLTQTYHPDMKLSQDLSDDEDYQDFPESFHSFYHTSENMSDTMDAEETESKENNEKPNAKRYLNSLD